MGPFLRAAIPALMTVLAGCAGRDPGATTDGGDTTGGGDPTTGAATDDPTTSSTGAEPPGTTGSATGTSSGDEPGEPPPAECAEPHWEIDATFEVEVDGVDPKAAFEFAAPCTVDHVVFLADLLAHTTLVCTIDDVATGVMLRVELSPDGPPAWNKGDSVHLTVSSRFDDEFGPGFFRRVTMRAADDALLLAAVEQDVLDPEWFAPVDVEPVFVCGPEEVDAPIVQMALRFTLPEGPALELVGGHRGELIIDGVHSYSIDIQEASVNHCCHYARWHHVVLRRVELPG